MGVGAVLIEQCIVRHDGESLRIVGNGAVVFADRFEGYTPGEKRRHEVVFRQFAGVDGAGAIVDGRAIVAGCELRIADIVVANGIGAHSGYPACERQRQYQQSRLSRHVPFRSPVFRATRLLLHRPARKPQRLSPYS